MDTDTESKINDLKKRKSLKKILKEKELGLRLLIGFICWISLSLFIHFKEVKVESLELNSTAPRYVVSQVDFEFPDEEAMVILKQEATSGIGKIYQIDSKTLKQTQYDFDHFLVRESNWRNKTDLSLEEIYEAVNALKDVLKKARFTDAFTKNKIKKYNLLTENYFIYSPKNNEERVLPSDYWNYIRNRTQRNTEIKRKALDFVIDYYKQKPLVLDQDNKTKSELTEYIRESIPQKFTQVKAGTKIIAQGEVVRSRHLGMLQEMKKALNEKRNIWAPFTILGHLLLAWLIIAISGFYLKIKQKDIFYSLQKLSLLACIFIFSLAFAKITEYVLLENANNFIDIIRYPLIVPFATLLVLILFNSRLALYNILVLSIILTATLAVDQSKFLIINVVSSLAIIVGSKPLRKRKEVFELAGKGFVGVFFVILAFNIIEKNYWSMAILSDIGISILFMLIIAILTVGLLPILESLFNIMTGITLMEYMDPNNELLRRLALEMPGTYQHSLVLGNLSEAAAHAINANALLCRVATLYHDIGKLNNTQFFTENQQAGVNIHQLLTPAESAQVIISHIQDGVMLAKKYRLPQAFIEIIQQHHGTSIVYYFYHKAVEIQGGDKSKVDQSKFRYLGPKPRSKEAAIIMITDGIEAASRSLDEVSEETISTMIDKVVKDKIDDGQLDECDITFREISIVKLVLIKTLIVTRHVRVKYPEKKESK